ncbi:glycosyltransferase family 2 protein [Gordonia hongkongensis]|uniref:4,4'-diaponeurosporenoate glycosyltransferase n=1 Tax=Gordonia hongkongensis TaxID=1701090 RepID=A0AAX3T4X7_9ACTN|nr:glycosyltransferase family 2 protein [Gordonia hongkongensis]MDF6101202.1 glycosyltransferase [Gordonia hongkongensis]QIK46966.1 glycosyltransferase family 2 protein [Gordonia terrae]UPG67364.1 glycosyltransferase [Gordonia hongkongensis]WFP24010.1 glycosyltransferase family 2 protein [Gordonia hongkongensis]
MPTLSVVIPAFNEEENLGPCLDRLLAQTVPIDEIIVVNNCSTDRTVDIADDYATRHASVRRIDEPRPGIHVARRCGLDNATSEILAKVDADTRVPALWAEVGIRFFDSNADGGPETAAPRDASTDTDSPAAKTGNFGALTGPFLMHDAPMYERQQRIATKSYRKLANGGPIQSVHGPAYFIRGDAWRTIRDDLHDHDPIWEDLDIGLALQNHGLGVYFDPRLLADSSCRRLRFTPWRNIRYALGGIHTARAHGQRKVAAAMALNLPFRLAMYVYFWLLLRPWDNETRTWRPYRFFRSA